MSGLLLILLAIVPVYSQYPCGDIQIADKSECHCGETTLTYRDYWDGDKTCCGPAQCSIEARGSGQCSAGTVCSGGSPWLCGDIIITHDSECLCGGDRIAWDDQWCCLPDTEQCEYQDSGVGVCANGTLVTGYHNSCNGNCGKREYFPCRSGGECVPKADMCHGYPVCADASDIDYCQQGKDICGYDYRYSKCPGTTTYGHQECYRNDQGGINDQGQRHD